MTASWMLRLVSASLVICSPAVASVGLPRRDAHDDTWTCSATPLYTEATLNLVCHPLAEPAKAARGLWEVRMTADKGRGLFAVVDIPQGTRLLAEDPLVTVEPPPMVPGRGFQLSEMLPPVREAFDGLSPAQQETYLACHEVRFGDEGKDEDGESTVSGGRLLRILRSNAYNMQDGRVGLYPTVALINHDCRPNVLNADVGRQRVIVATRDIAAGEEIATTYVPLLADTASRRARLAQYGFTCMCAACRSGSDDDERVRMKQVLDDVSQAAQHGGRRTRAKRKEDADKAVLLGNYVREHGFADYGAQTSQLAAELADRAGDVETAVAWAARHVADVQRASEEGADRTTRGK